MSSKNNFQKNSLELIRSGNKEALDLVTPPLNILITNELKKRGIYASELRDNIISDTFYDLIRKKGSLPNITDPLPYLKGMAKKIILRYLDKKKIEYQPTGSFLDYPDNNTINDNDDNEEIKICLESFKILLKMLPKSYASLMEDFWLKGKSRSEICRERKYKSTKVFSSMKSQALKKLREVIDQSENHSVLKNWLKRQKKNKDNDKRK